jgi:Uma2 family endonuclease
MAMPVRVPTYTTDDLRAFPEDGCRYELLDGMLLVTPAPSTDHQVVQAQLLIPIGHYLGDAGPARVVGPGAIEIAPKTSLEPDVLVFPSSYPRSTPWPKIHGWWLAVEVFSRSSRVYDRDFKRDVYLALGVREVWLVDRIEEAIFVSKPGSRKDVRRTGRFAWHPEEMSAPLGIDCAKLF